MKPIVEPWTPTLFYRANLTESYRKAYDLIYEGMIRWEDAIRIPMTLTDEQLSMVHSCVDNDHPLLFHRRSGFKYLLFSGASILYPHYCCTPTEYDALFQQVQQFTLSCVGKLKGVSDFRRVRAIHDTIAMYIPYGVSANTKSHNVLGVIVDHSAVCEGIAKCFKMICDAADIPCIVVDGWTDPADRASGKSATHSWNCVYINGSWYNMDLTWDLKTKWIDGSRMPRYHYFCRSDSVMNRDHIPYLPKPACKKDFDLYKASGRFVRSRDELKNLLASILSDGQPEYQIEFAEGVDMSDLWPCFPMQYRYGKFSIYTNKEDRRLTIIREPSK